MSSTFSNETAGSSEAGSGRGSTSSRACIIGAGSSGLAAAKVFAERGIAFDCFEMGSDVGGLWRYESDTGRSPVYRSLRTNTSRDRTAFSDFSMPPEYPDYPSHAQMLAYFEAYADRFELRRHIRFRSRVTRVRPSGDDAYIVSWRDEDSAHEARYGAVVAASGHHWKPNVPDVPGSFSGEALHARSYRTPDELAGSRVLVVGIGNSACDIVCEVSRVADRTFLSTRRSAHVIPKYLLGRPLDTWLSPMTARLPFTVRRALFKLLIHLERGRQQTYGLRVPDHDLGAEHPTISSDLLPLIRDGFITPKPDIEELQGDRVGFADGSAEAIDVIVYATGYLLAYPFLECVDVRDNELPLYHHVVHPSRPHLYFLGVVQPLGALPPLAEAQSEWVADLLEGRAGLPSTDEMRKAIRTQEEALRRRYVDSKRHRMEVEVHPYLRALRRERRKGRGRAASQALGTRSSQQPAAEASLDI